MAGTTYEKVYDGAMELYKQNMKGDLEIAKALGVEWKEWHAEDEIALERSNCKANNAIMIGDRIDNDMISANLLGIHTIWIKQDFGQYWNITKEIERAEYTVNSLIGICNIL